MARKKRKGFVYHVNFGGIQRDICAVSSRQAKWLFAKEDIEEAHSQKIYGTVRDRINHFKRVIGKGSVAKTQKGCLF